MILKEVCLMEKSKMKTPDGTYIGVKFSKDTCDAIKKFCKDNKIPNTVSRDKLHTTIIYSRKFDDLTKDENIGILDTPWIGIPKEFDIWKTQDGKHALVLKYDCLALEKEHKRLMSKYDLVYDFPSYIPHCSISYDVAENFDKSKLNIKDFPKIEITKSYLEDLVIDWQNKT